MLPLEKAKSGLAAFLELPVQNYSSSLTIERTARESRAIRIACSAILTGILIGFAKVDFGGSSGSLLLTESLPRWAQCLPLLRKDHLAKLLPFLQQGSLQEPVSQNVLPFCEAVDAECGGLRGSAVPPQMFFDAYRQRIEITIKVLVAWHTNPFIVAHCYLDSTRVTSPQLSQARPQRRAYHRPPARSHSTGNRVGRACQTGPRRHPD